jgi:hypothetical protein
MYIIARDGNYHRLQLKFQGLYARTRGIIIWAKPLTRLTSDTRTQEAIQRGIPSLRFHLHDMASVFRLRKALSMESKQPVR